MKNSDAQLSKSLYIPKKAPGRIWEIDLLRGLFFLGVFLFHLGWDIAMLPSVFSNFYFQASPSLRRFVSEIGHILYLPSMTWLVRIFSGGFLLLTGICCSLSKDNLLRGLKILSWGELLTVITVIICLVGQTEELIVFGILHCIGFTIALFGLYQRLERELSFRTPAWLYIALGILVWLVGYYFIYGLKAESASAGNLVSFADIDPKNILAIVVGTKCSYGDSFPLFPNAGKVLVGIGLGKLCYGERRGKVSLFPKLDGWWFAPLKFIGRHSLILYLGEQAVAWVVIVLVMIPLGYTLGF